MKRLRLRGRSLALTMGIAQSGIGLGAAVLCWLLIGTQAALAAGFGALIAVVPGLYFALRVLKPRPDASPRQLLAVVYGGEVGKLVLTGGMFVLGVALFSAQFLPLMLTYVACLSLYWLAMLVN